MIGHSFGSYTVERELGRGGMGAVYTAVHSLLGRRAAVKVLLAELSRDQATVQRFFNEARAATAIKHPSIVEIYDFGFAPDGSAFIVMELLDGESLADRLRRSGRLPVATALVLARQIATALGAAHAAGIVHRDLKPDNAFLVRDPEVAGGERVKLLDFGIAKLAANTSGARTSTGAVMGTPLYMSPEQCEGSRAVDHRTDFYALGCMLFQMISGRLPFESEGVGGLIGMHLYVPAPPLRSVAPDAPAAVEAFVARLLAKAPDDRPRAADEVVAALEQLGATTSSHRAEAAPPAPSYPPPAPSYPPSAPSYPPSAPTTLSSAAAAAPTAPTAPTPAPRGRRGLLLGVGGVLAAGAVVTAVVLAGGGGGSSSGATPTGPAGGGLASGGPIDAASSADAAPAIDAAGDVLYSQAELAVKERRWDTALALGNDLATANHPMAAAIVSQAKQGKTAADALAAMEQANAAHEYHAVRTKLDVVRTATLDGDPDRARAEALATAAGPLAIAKAEADVGKLTRAGKCGDARTVAATVAGDWGTADTAAISKAAAKCKASSSGGVAIGDEPGLGSGGPPGGPPGGAAPSPAAALVDEAAQAAVSGQYARALSRAEQALVLGGLRPTERMKAINLAALASCHLKHEASVRKYYAQVRGAARAGIRQTCLKTMGLDPDGPSGYPSAR